MPLSVAVLMDPIGAIKIAKDTTFAMLLEAQRRGHACYYIEQGDLALRDGAPWARLAPAERHARIRRLVSRWAQAQWRRPAVNSTSC